MKQNPFVHYLNRYTTVTPEHEAAFDEFITQTAPPSGAPLRIDTKIEAFLRETFRQPRPPSVILTGNAGDGKTYLCRQIVESFTGTPVTGWEGHTDWPITRDGLTLRVVKDLSEMDEQSGARVLREVAVGVQQGSNDIFLIAANEGRLRALLQRERLETLYELVDQQLRHGPAVEDPLVIVINLNQATTSAYIEQVLAWLTEPVHWDACANCPALAHCPIRFNANRLANPQIRERLAYLYRIFENLAIHATIRDMLIHLAYTVTGGLDCGTVIDKSRQLGWEAFHHVYYENVWGETGSAFLRRKISVIKNLRMLDVSHNSYFEVDDFIINGSPDDHERQEQHETLFAPALDLGGSRFEQDRRAYLRGGAASPDPAEEHQLMNWLPHVRRKLYFEWQNADKANRLFPFLTLSQYFQLLKGEESQLDRYVKELILGLNRSFTGLYITDASNLYVTSQYARAVDQPMPIVRVQIPTLYIKLQVKPPSAEALDSIDSTLHLIIPPPPLQSNVEPYKWKIDLLRFEYLIRRARGGTPNVLAAECELSIRQFKDDLLAQFVKEEADTRKVQFFAAKQNRYQLMALWVDEAGNLRV